MYLYTVYARQNSGPSGLKVEVVFVGYIFTSWRAVVAPQLHGDIDVREVQL